MNKCNRVGITAPAFNMDNKIQDRFKEFIRRSMDINDNLKVDIYLPQLESEVLHKSSKQFSRSKSLNSGIKELIDHGVDVIICTDVDMIIPPGLIRYSYNKAIQTNKNIFTMTRYIEELAFNNSYPDWKIFNQIPTAHSGYGGFNAMIVDTWKKSGGLNEEASSGWGFEDIEFRERLIRKGIDTITLVNFPLLHINHPPRSNNQRETQRNNVNLSNSKNWDSYNWLEI